jgi:hypothetical protein
VHNDHATTTLFKTPPIIHFESDIAVCPHCSQTLSVVKTHTRTIATLAIGVFIAHETIRTCANPSCKNEAPYRSQELSKIVPQQGRYGYDVMVFVGKQLFIACRNEADIIAQLNEKGIPISRSEIGVLARKFIIYLSIAHQESNIPLRLAMQNRGGYILHMDSTCDADSPHLMSVLDGMSELVLDNIKIPSENADQLIPFLQQVKNDFGTPIATVHDMAKGILLAVSTVFPSTPDFICHFHFLRDIGKDLLSTYNDLLRKRFRAHGTQVFLSRQAHAIKSLVEDDPTDINTLQSWLCDNNSKQFSLETLAPAPIAYSLINWILEGKHDGDGYGFPFDRPYLSFFQRLREAYQIVDILRFKFDNAPKCQRKLFGIIWKKIHEIIGDPIIKKAVCCMEEKSIVFDQLRQAMRIALPHEHDGLNDGGKEEMDSICKSVSQFDQQLIEKIKTTNDVDYQKMHDQIRFYWNKLFADPIIKNTPSGQVTIYPQRTNNLLERFFRNLRRNYRKRSGTNTMTKALKSILADTPLVANLNNREYCTLLLNGEKSLETRFAQIDVKLVRDKLHKEQMENQALSPVIKKIIRIPDFFNKMLRNLLSVKTPTAF